MAYINGNEVLFSAKVNTTTLNLEVIEAQNERESIKNIVTTKNLLTFAEYVEGKIYNLDGSITENSSYNYYKLKLPAGEYFINSASTAHNLTIGETIITTDDVDSVTFTLGAESEIVINSYLDHTQKLFSTEYTADEVEALGEYTLGENVHIPQIEKNSIHNIATTKNLLTAEKIIEGYQIKADGSVNADDAYDHYLLTLPAGTYTVRAYSICYNLTTGEKLTDGSTVGASFTLTEESKVGVNSFEGRTKKLYSTEYTADEVEALGEYTLGENVLTPEIDAKIAEVEQRTGEQIGENAARFESAEEQISKNTREITTGSIENIVATKNLLTNAEFKERVRIHINSVTGEIQESESADHDCYILTLPAGTYGFTSTAAHITNLTTQTAIANANTNAPFTLDAESVIAISSWRKFVKKLYSTEYTADEVEALGEYTLGDNVQTPVIDAKIAEVEQRTGEQIGENAAKIAEVERGVQEAREECATKANGITATKKGYPLRIDDASPTTHKLNLKARSKNLLIYPYADTTKTTNGITFTDNGDGSITISGTATGAAFFNLSKILNFDGEYAFSERINYNADNHITSIYIPKGTVANETLYPQVERGTVSTEYTPYVDLSTNPKIRISNKNIIPYPYYDTANSPKTDGGITFTDNGDGSVTVSGTATKSAFFHIVHGGVRVMKGETALKGFAASPYLYQDFSKGHMSIYIPKGTTINETLYPQIEIDSQLTEYVLGVGTDYTINVDATVDGALSVTPDMSIVPENNGLIVEVEYNVDTNALAERVTSLENKAFDCEKYGLPVLKFTGDITEMTKDNAVTLDYEYGDLTGTCTLKWQGTSSIAYPKKNYTVKFDSAFEAADGWGEEKKYCLKANYIDFSHARNLVGAKLWGAIVASRDGVENYPKLLTAPNGGAVDGFPICVVINGEYVGLYTFNIPKDGWMFGMGEGTSEGIVCAEQPSENGGIVCKWESADVVLGRDYDIEYAPDEDNVEWMQTSLRTLIQTCIDTDGTNLSALEAVLDVNSAIDYYIFSVLTNNYDGLSKNHLLATYDGTKWMFGAYDMDCLWGMYWDGSRFIGNSLIGYWQHGAFDVVVNHYKDTLKARYQELREDILSEDNFATVLTNFIGSIPKALLDEEVKIWTGLLNTSANNHSQMLDWYRRQVIKADAHINSL